MVANYGLSSGTKRWETKGKVLRAGHLFSYFSFFIRKQPGHWTFMNTNHRFGSENPKAQSVVFYPDERKEKILFTKENKAGP